MMKKPSAIAAVLAAVVLSGVLAMRLAAADPQDSATPAAAKAGGTQGGGGERFFEMRTYYAAEGKIDNLNARFRDHTNKLFRKHGIEMIGYWQPVDEKNQKKPVLVYILAYPS